MTNLVIRTCMRMQRTGRTHVPWSFAGRRHAFVGQVLGWADREVEVITVSVVVHACELFKL